jgi:hypothetical protein
MRTGGVNLKQPEVGNEQLRTNGSWKSRRDMRLELHKHSSYDAVVHEFEKFFLTDREPMKDPY